MADNNSNETLVDASNLTLDIGSMTNEEFDTYRNSGMAPARLVNISSMTADEFEAFRNA